MNPREQLRNPFVQQYLLEILLPLIGFFFFGWSLAIIAVFYLLDQLAAETSFLRKFIKIRKAENKSPWLLLFPGVVIFSAAMILEVSLLFEFFKNFGSKDIFKIYDEIEAFAKEELWLLFPLILVMYYIKDQFTFFVPRRHLQKQSNRFFLWQQIKTLSICALVAAGFFTMKNSFLPETAAVAIFLVAKIGFDLTLGKLAEKKSGKA